MSDKEKYIKYLNTVTIEGICLLWEFSNEQFIIEDGKISGYIPGCQ